jgi:long-chain acyl-CoA synthetase
MSFREKNMGNQILDTLPKYLRRNFLQYGDQRVAMRVKEAGIWKPYTWKDYYENVKWISLGLISLGFKEGHKLCVIGESKPQWIWAEMAAQASGATPVGVFTDCMANEVKFFINHSDASFVVAEDQEQVDKILQIKDDLPN